MESLKRKVRGESKRRSVFPERKKRAYVVRERAEILNREKGRRSCKAGVQRRTDKGRSIIPEVRGGVGGVPHREGVGVLARVSGVTKRVVVKRKVTDTERVNWNEYSSN